VSHLRHGLMRLNDPVDPSIDNTHYATCGTDKDQCPGNVLSRALVSVNHCRN